MANDFSDDFSDAFIPIITYVEPSHSTTDPTRLSKGTLGDTIDTPRSGTRSPVTEKGIGQVNIPAKRLEDQMTHLLKSMGSVLSNARQRAGEIAGMELDSIELSVEINAEGQVSLMGIGGAQAGASGAITLTFTRTSSNP